MELRRRNERQADRLAEGRRQIDDRFLQVEQQPERHVQEITAAASGVKDLNGSELLSERGQQRQRLAAENGAFAPSLRARRGGALGIGGLIERAKLVGQQAHLGLNLDPFAPQRGHQHRLDDQQDVILRREMRAELRAFVRVQTALE